MARGRSAIAVWSLNAAILLISLGWPRPVRGQSAFDLEGNLVNSLNVAHGKVVVLIFLRRDCPVSSRYAPVIQKISAEHERDTSFWLVFPDKAETPREIRKYVQDYAYRLPALRDPEHVLAKRSQAELTPEAAVFDGNGRLVYHGRIDNWYFEFGRSRPAPTTHELSDAIESASTGKPLAHSTVRGVGCYISDLE
jgi:hypothetical protein